MKRKMRNVVLTIMLFVVIAVNVRMVLDIKDSYNLSMNSIEALSDGGDNPGSGLGDDMTGPETGAGISSQKECRDKFGYWDMALICDGGGVETTQCEIDGEISFLGISVSGSYKRGKSYKIAWERWSCKNASGNCCAADQQGVRVKQ